MSDISNVDGATESVANSTPAAPPPGSDTQGSAPASVDTTAPGQETTEQAQEPDRQNRREARAFAAQRRQINELQRELGRMQERIASSQRGQGAPEGGEPARGEQTEVERLRAEIREQEAARSGRTFWSSAAKEAKDKGIDGFADAQDAIRTGEVPTNPAMSHYLTEEADNKAALIVWLADNPEEAERIAGLDPVKAGAALAKQDARLSAKPVKKTTQAPPPVPTVGGRSTAEFDADKASMDEYAAHWKARQAKG